MVRTYDIIIMYIMSSIIFAWYAQSNFCFDKTTRKKVANEKVEFVGEE